MSNLIKILSNTSGIIFHENKRLGFQGGELQIGEHFISLPDTKEPYPNNLFLYANTFLVSKGKQVMMEIGYESEIHFGYDFLWKPNKEMTKEDFVKEFVNAEEEVYQTCCRKGISVNNRIALIAVKNKNRKNPYDPNEFEKIDEIALKENPYQQIISSKYYKNFRNFTIKNNHISLMLPTTSKESWTPQDEQTEIFVRLHKESHHEDYINLGKFVRKLFIRTSSFSEEDLEIKYPTPDVRKQIKKLLPI